MFNNTTTLPDGPSATFSSPLLTISYGPAGLAYEPSDVLIRLLVRLHLLLAQPFLLLGALVFSSLLLHLYTRLRALETTFASLTHISRVLAIQRTTIAALITTQFTIEARLDTLSSDLHAAISHLDTDMTTNLNQIDTDIAALSVRSKLQRERMRVLERNLDMARDVLGAGVESSVDDGLEMGMRWRRFDLLWKMERKGAGMRKRWKRRLMWGRVMRWFGLGLGSVRGLRSV